MSGFQVMTRDELVTAIDAITTAEKNTINSYLSNNTPSSDWLTDNLERLAANIMMRYDQEEIDDINNDLDNYYLESEDRPSPPSGAGRIWTKLVQVFTK